MRSGLEAGTNRQPSPVLNDEAKSTYVFRLTDARPAEKPKSIDEVAKQVEEDWRLARAYELAKQQAEAIAASARSSPADTLTPATQPASPPSTGPTSAPADESSPDL